jgi:uroporphyrinogen-III decarboxylase
MSGQEMTPRERVRRAINHEAPDMVPLDLGSTSVTGIHVTAYRALERLLGIGGEPVRVIDPFQMLAEVGDPVREALGVDTFGVQLPCTVFGFRNENWKPWRLFDGTEVQVAGGFEYDTDARGDILLYPQGDRRARPSGRMAKDGYYFDAVVRQPPIEEERLDPRRWVEQSFSLYTDEDARYLEETSRRAYEETDYAVIGNFCDGGLGDIGIVPGPNVKDPVGIRDPEEWYVSLVTRKDYIGEIFEIQTDMALKNLEVYRQACGDRVDVLDVSEADFGGQRGLLFSRDVFRELFKPRLERINRWIHARTGWKIFYHSCGAISEILEDLVEIGVDIINPVQYTAQCMDLAELKRNFGGRLVFWGGGVDTQRVLPFGTPEEVWGEVGRTIDTLSAGGGYVFSAVHNIQANIPRENLAALFGAFKTHRRTDDAKTR